MGEMLAVEVGDPVARVAGCTLGLRTVHSFPCSTGRSGCLAQVLWRIHNDEDLSACPYSCCASTAHCMGLAPSRPPILRRRKGRAEHTTLRQVHGEHWEAANSSGDTYLRGCDRRVDPGEDGEDVPGAAHLWQRPPRSHRPPGPDPPLQGLLWHRCQTPVSRWLLRYVLEANKGTFDTA